jgi:hypothetical protein
MDDPPRLQVIEGEANAQDKSVHHPEIVEFVRWFTNWWLTRGLELVAKEDGEERRAA